MQSVFSLEVRRVVNPKQACSQKGAVKREGSRANFSSRPTPSRHSRLISCPACLQALFRETNEKETDSKKSNHDSLLSRLFRLN